MNKVEDRTDNTYKSQEQSFYSNQWIYNERISNIDEELKYDCYTNSQKEEKMRERQELIDEKQSAIDNWKESHGAYDEGMTKWSLSEAIEHEKKGEGLKAFQSNYDKNQYGHEEYDKHDCGYDKQQDEYEY